MKIFKTRYINVYHGVSGISKRTVTFYNFEDDFTTSSGSLAKKRMRGIPGAVKEYNKVRGTKYSTKDFQVVELDTVVYHYK